MKAKIKIVCTFLILSVFAFGCTNAQNKKTKRPSSITNISFNNFSKSPDLGSGFWTASLEDGKVYLQILNSRRNTNGTFMISFSVDENEFKRTNNGFELDREAGIMKFEGAFPIEENTGKFTFTRKTDFESFLNGKIMSSIEGDKDYYFFKLFLGNITRTYVNELQKMGYKPTMRQLGKLGIHDVDIDYIKELRSTKYSNLDLDMMIKWAIHGVSVYYVDQLAKAGYGAMDANMVKNFAIHSISIDYIKGLAKAGYGNLEPNMIKNFAIHNVSIDYINGLAKAGYKNLDANMIKKFAIHSISLKYINGLSKVGYGNLDPNTLKNFAVHSIRPSYIQDLLSTNISKPNANTIKKAKIHNVTANFIERAKRKGHDSNDLYDYVKLKIRGI